MNRLILIGNGFDLAHGLKTSYNDFILWYLKSAFVEAHKKHRYGDDILSIKPNRLYRGPLRTEEDIITWVKSSYHQSFSNILPGSNNHVIGWTDGSNDTSPFIVDILSDLLTSLMRNCSADRWVDIEGLFYKDLKAILKVKDNATKSKKLDEVNHSLTFLIGKLELYLQSLPRPPFILGYEEILLKPILDTEVHGSQFFVTGKPDETMILNFNYTNTLDAYIDRLKGIPTLNVSKVNFIHGRLKDNKNPLIFGFGDELDSDYLRLEEEQVNGYFEYVKSFWYFRTTNYRNLVNFLDISHYQVVILGHSCGLSDRTMLNMIFEHINCKSIKIYYHEHDIGNNFVPLTHEIARHFKDKGEMRKKIVSLDRSEPMPQVI